MASTSQFIQPSILSSQDFNKIPPIHDQKEFDYEMWNAITAVFKQHNVDTKYGPQVLHRHYDMPEGAIALTTRAEKFSITKITPSNSIDPAAIRGQLYLLNEEGKFQAYEYEYGTPVPFPDAFLEDLANFLRKYDIRERFSLASSAAEQPTTVEIAVGSEATVSFSSEKFKERKEGGEIFIHIYIDDIFYVGDSGFFPAEKVFDFEKEDIGSLLQQNGFI